MVTIRAARAEDRAEIRRIVMGAHLDPTWLDWQHFNVAETEGEIVGVAQIKPHADCREFASFAVKPAHQSRGVGAQLLETTLAGECGPTFLICRDALASYYARFAFREVPLAAAPRTLQRKLRLARLFRAFGVRVICMQR